MPSHEHALVVGKFAPLHAGHHALIERAFHEATHVTVLVWSNPDFVDMPSPVRAAWIRASYPSATVLVGDDGPPNDAPGPAHWEYVRQTLLRHELRPDVVLTSEAYGAPFAAHLGIEHVLVDLARTTVPISGSAVRADVHAARPWLHPQVYAHFVDKVVFLGAESTGKSTLAERMAAELDTVFVPEYGRIHYEERNGVLDLDDYVVIAERHRELEDDAATRAHRWLFVDTNAITTMFFSHYYNRESRPRLRELAAQCRDRYRHVFVCDDDIAFEQDGWRDNTDWRARMQGMVLHDLAVREIPYHVVRGTLDERVEQVKTVLAGGSVGAAVAVRTLGPRPS